MTDKQRIVVDSITCISDHLRIEAEIEDTGSGTSGQLAAPYLLKVQLGYFF